MKDDLRQDGFMNPHSEKWIMLIDDDEDDQTIFLSVAQNFASNLRCITAWNGVEGLKILKDASTLPEYIFLDLNMPLMNGHQFLTEIKKVDSLMTVPIVILSTSSDRQSRNATMELGANYFISKPYQISAWEQELGPFFNSAINHVPPVSDVQSNPRNKSLPSEFKKH